MNLALAGNQNCGKTTLFNALTGSNQHGNHILFPNAANDMLLVLKVIVKIAGADSRFFSDMNGADVGCALLVEQGHGDIFDSLPGFHVALPLSASVSQDRTYLIYILGNRWPKAQTIS